MKMPDINGIYAITDCENCSDEELLSKSEIILNTGVAVFQYRDKRKKNKKELGSSLQRLCRNYNTPFIVNDDLQLAKELNADGIHLGLNDHDISTARKLLGNKIIGISCYDNLNRAIDAEKNGADYVAFGSFFPSLTKPDAVKPPIDLLIKAKSSLSIPIVAIGGITTENGKSLIKTKVNFLAVISGLYAATDTETVIKKYNILFN